MVDLEQKFGVRREVVSKLRRRRVTKKGGRKKVPRDRKIGRERKSTNVTPNRKGCGGGGGGGGGGFGRRIGPPAENP